MESTFSETLIARVRSKTGWSRTKAIAWLEKTFGRRRAGTSPSPATRKPRPVSDDFDYQFVGVTSSEEERERDC